MTEPSLQRVLAARDARALAQRVLAAEYGWPVLSVGVLTPGPVKDTPLARALFAQAVNAVAAVLGDGGWVSRGGQESLRETGPELLAALPGVEAAAVKRALAELEDTHPLGRLWDLDVVGAGGPLARTELGLPRRTCLLCSRPSPECARSRRHSVEELLDEMERRYAAYTLDMPLLAHHALVVEARHTPKPGLVDAENNGAHADMDLALLIRSADALRPWWSRFVDVGQDTAELDPAEALAAARPLGVEAEGAMRDASGGVNTHAGAVFSLGLLCLATGRLIGRGRPVTREAVVEEAALLATPTLVELGVVPRAGKPAGGLGGAREEAASGFPTVMLHALPAYDTARGDGAEMALAEALLALLEHTADTNVVADAGLDAGEQLRRIAGDLRRDGGARHPAYVERMRALDADLTARGISPGGAADLLAVTWLLAQLPSAAS